MEQKHSCVTTRLATTVEALAASSKAINITNEYQLIAPSTWQNETNDTRI